MKFIVVVALFAFVAVQLCQAAPRPDDDKKEDAAAAAAIPPAAPPAAAVAEVKSEAASPDAAAKVDVSVAPPEDKKE